MFTGSISTRAECFDSTRGLLRETVSLKHHHHYLVYLLTLTYCLLCCPVHQYVGNFHGDKTQLPGGLLKFFYFPQQVCVSLSNTAIELYNINNRLFLFTTEVTDEAILKLNF